MIFILGSGSFEKVDSQVPFLGLEHSSCPLNVHLVELRGVAIAEDYH